MIHFKKDVAYVKMANAIHDFIFPSSLNDIKEENTTLLNDIFDFPQSKSLTKFVELRKHTKIRRRNIKKIFITKLSTFINS